MIDMSRLAREGYDMVMFVENPDILNEFQSSLPADKTIDDKLRELIRFEIIGARYRARNRQNNGKT